MTNTNAVIKMFRQKFHAWQHDPNIDGDPRNIFVDQTSGEIEDFITATIEHTIKEERERINKEWLSLNLRNDNEANWKQELDRFGVFMQALNQDK